MSDFPALARKLASMLHAGDRAGVVAELRRLDCDRPSMGIDELNLARLAVMVDEAVLVEGYVDRFLGQGAVNDKGLLLAATALAECARPQGALDIISPALEKRSSAPLRHFAGTVCQQLGRFAEAESHLYEALSLGGFLSGVSWLTLAAQVDFSVRDDLLKKVLAMKGSMQATSDENIAAYLYAVGKALLDCQDFDAAFQSFSAGAQLLNRGVKYDALTERAYIEKILQHYPGELQIANENPIDDKENSPVFIVGLPRSGTTLVEQILASHSAVAGGGEFSGLRQATMHLGSAASLRPLRNSIGEVELDRIKDVYNYVARQRFGGGGIIVDKSISNVFYLGVIAETFPDSKIIHVERNPGDVAWSCFRTRFSQGMQWSYALENIADHFNNLDCLMAHWKRVLGERIVGVQYEDLVKKPTASINRLLSCCGLEEEDSSHRFYEAPRSVSTASTAQVRRPIYASSVSGHLEVEARLSPFFERFRAGQ